LVGLERNVEASPLVVYDGRRASGRYDGRRASGRYVTIRRLGYKNWLSPLQWERHRHHFLSTPANLSKRKNMKKYKKYLGTMFNADIIIESKNKSKKEFEKVFNTILERVGKDPYLLIKNN
jgi:hypothetical protein